MAGIPPIHEEPPVGTNNMVEPPASQSAPDAEKGPLTPAPEVKQGPPLPADWSPVDPSPPDAPD